MKLLWDEFRNFQIDDKSGMVFFAEHKAPSEGEKKDEKKEESESNEKDNIEEILKNPLNCSLKHIRVLEEKIDLIKSDEKLKVKFNDLVAFHLTIAQRDYSSVPSRMAAAFLDSEKLRPYINSKIKKGLELCLETKKNSVYELVTKERPENWTDEETVKICSAYKYLQSTSVSVKGVDKQFFGTIKDSLISRTIPLLYRYQYEIDGDQIPSGEQKTKAEKVGKLSISEKMVLLEVGRIFPDTASWGVTWNFKNWGELAKNVAQQILGGEKNEKENPNYLLAWEILDDIVYADQKDFTGDQKKIFKELQNKPALEKLVKRGRVAEFMLFAKQQKTFLSIHLNVLEQMAHKDFEFLPPGRNIEDFIEALQEEDDKIKESQKEIETKKKELKEARESFHKYLTEKYGDTDEKVKKLKATQNKLEEAKKELLDAEKSKTNKNVLDEKRQAVRKADEEFKSADQSLWAKVDELVNDEEKNKLSVKKNDDDEEGKKIKKGPLAEKKETITRLETELGVLEKEKFKRLEKNRKYQDLFPIFKDPQKFIEETRDKYWNKDKKGSLIDRFNKANLYASDVEVLFSDFEGNISEETQLKKETLGIENKLETAGLNNKFEQLRAFRNKFKAVLKERLQSAETRIGALNVIGLEEDKYLPWLKITLEEFSRGKLQLGLEEEGINLVRNIFGETQNVQQIFDGMLWHFRDDIVETVKTGLEQAGSSISDPNKKEAYERNVEHFLAHWDRLHKKIEDPETITSHESFFEREEKREKSHIKILEEENQTTQAYAQSICSRSLKDVLADVDTKKINDFEKIRLYRELLDWQNLTDHSQRIEKRNEVHSKVLDIVADLSDERVFFEGDSSVTDIDKKRELLAHKLTERILVERVSFWRKEHLLNGKTLPEDINSKEMFIPGTNILKKISLETWKEKEELQNEFDSINREIGEIKTGFKHLSQESATQSEARKKELAQRLQSFLTQWPSTHAKIQSKVGDLKFICEQVFIKEFGHNPHKLQEKLQAAKVFFAAPEKLLSQIDQHFGEFTKFAQRENYFVSGDESLFHHIPKCFVSFVGLLDVSDGFWIKEVEQRIADGDTKAVNKGIGISKNLGLPDDTTADKAEFRERVESARTGFIDHYVNYQNTFRSVKLLIEKDLSSLDEDKFYAKYQATKDRIRDVLQSHEDQIKGYDGLWKQFDGPDFVPNWLHKYNQGGEDYKEAMVQLSHWESMGKSAQKARELADHLSGWLKDYKDKHKNQGFFARLQNRDRTEFSLYDIFATVKKAVEANDVNWKRKSDRAVSALGVHFFGTNNYFGKEFWRLGEESEAQRIKEFQSRYHDRPSWEIKDAIARSRDADEVRACINLLSEKGALHWDDPLLWKAFNKLQNAVHFDAQNDMDLSTYEIHKKVKAAASAIWSQQVFDEWDRNLDDQAKKAEGGYAREFESLENDPTARTEILSGMLQRWARGETDDIDPARYAMFIRESFRLGKMNGQPDQRFYFIVQGITLRNPKTGQTILSRDFLQRMGGEFLARFPHVDFFADKTSPKLNGRIVPEDIPGAEERAWNHQDYEAWAQFLGDSDGSFNPTEGSGKSNTIKFFYFYVHMSPFARDRVQRMQRFSEQEGDHDDSWVNFVEWMPRQVRYHLNRRSEGTEKSSPDWWRTFLSCFPYYMKAMNEYIEMNDGQWGTDPAWQIEKERLLMEVGNRLKVAIEATQALLGNYVNYGDKSRVTFFDEDEWNKPGTNYSPALSDSLGHIKDFMMKVFNVANDGSAEKFQEILDFHGATHGTSVVELEKSEKWRKINEKSLELINGDSGGRYFFTPQYIESAMKQYAAGGERTSFGMAA